VWSAAKHNKSRCALLKEGRFQVTWKNAVLTCHTPLESLNFSGSFGAKNYFLNQIFVYKKIRKTKVQKKINKLILKWMSRSPPVSAGLRRSPPVSAALVTYIKRTAEIQNFQRCKALLWQPLASYLKLAFCRERASNLCCVEPYLWSEYGATQHKFEARSF
jgi:hypothetical protein